MDSAAMLPQEMEEERKAVAPDATTPAINLSREIPVAIHDFAISPALNVGPSVPTSAIYAGVFRVGILDYFLFVNSLVVNLPKNAPPGLTPQRFAAYSVRAVSTKINIFRAFKIGLPYSFAYTPIADSKVIYPICSSIQDIKMRMPKSKNGPEPSVRGTMLAPKGNQIAFLMTDIPDVKLINPCEILLYRDQIPEGYQNSAPGANFMLEIRTGTSMNKVNFPCVGKLSYAFDRDNWASVPIRDVPPPHSLMAFVMVFLSKCQLGATRLLESQQSQTSKFYPPVG